MAQRSSDRGRRRQEPEEVAAKKRPSLIVQLIRIFSMIIACCVVGIAVLFGVVYVKYLNVRSQIPPQVTVNPETGEETIITPSEQLTLPEYVGSIISGSSDKTYNIVIFGLDTRDPDQLDSARSDVIILMSLDQKNKKIKLTSFMRDILVTIPGHDKNRINTAITAGGPELAQQVIEENFGIDVDYYAVVNFWTVADAIDIMNGVQIDLKSEEVDELNIALQEINHYAKKGTTAPNVSKSGLQTLNGRQAVAYMRIRHVGNGDFERTQRQRNVLRSLFSAVKTMNSEQLIRLAAMVPTYSKTNVPVTTIPKLAMVFYNLRSSPVEELRIPVDGGYKIGTYKKMSVIELDDQINRDAIKEFLEK